MRNLDREYIAEVAQALRDGKVVHPEILLDAARLVDPEVALRERTEILRRIVLAHDENGTTYTARD